MSKPQADIKAEADVHGEEQVLDLTHRLTEGIASCAPTDAAGGRDSGRLFFPLPDAFAGPGAGVLVSVPASGRPPPIAL